MFSARAFSDSRQQEYCPCLLVVESSALARYPRKEPGSKGGTSGR